MTIWLIILIVLIAGGALAIWLRLIFEGEWLPGDLLREWRLSRVTLAELDRRWAESDAKSEIVVSLTTTPSRIAMLDHALKSVLDQDRPPARILLNVPYHSRRENVDYQIPPELEQLQCLRINRGDDYGPATKVIPALLSEPADRPVLVVDDDRIYPRWLTARYEAELARSPDRALTMAGWVVPEDLIDVPTTILSSFFMRSPAPVRAPRLRKPRQIDVMLGVMSYLVQPRFFDLDAICDFSTGPEALRFVDDVRTSALCRAEKWVIPAPSLSFVPRSDRSRLQATRLGLINRGPGGHENRNNSIGIRYFRDRWRVGGNGRTQNG